MIFNDEKFDLEEIKGQFIINKNSSETNIEVKCKDFSIVFTFNDDEFDPRKLELNKKVDIKKSIYWDVDIVYKDIVYVFDLTKDIINLTRLDDNLFHLEVKIENPDMIYSIPRDNSFRNLIIEEDFSFIY